MSGLTALPRTLFSGETSATEQSVVGAMIMRGECFYLNHHFTLNTGDSKYFLFEVGDAGTVVASRSIQVNGAFTYEVFRLPEASGGTPLDTTNLNENFYLYPVGIAITEDPVVVAEGVRIDTVRSEESNAQSKIEVGIFNTDSDLKRVLAAGGKYLVKFTAVTSDKEITYNVLMHKDLALRY